ncbi:MAG: helix-turn-helix domain-containing protein [Proteobacteria bacterium]|nr:helix-turn-helix domain-containing protein [Pseudomonadota bacterium]
MKKSNPEKNTVDMHIGKRIQLRRNMIGLSQKDLGEKCGVTFQQIQKYESGANRIVASRLFQIGMILETPVSFFFSGLPRQIATGDVVQNPRRYKVSSPADNDPLSRNETLQLINLYWKLPSDDLRRSVMRLLMHLSGEKSDGGEKK